MQVWKSPVLFSTSSWGISRKSHLTPFIANGLRKAAERGIIDNNSKRNIIPEPNCRTLNQEGQPLGMEKFAPLFVFFVAGCILSLVIFALENVFKPIAPELKMQSEVTFKNVEFLLNCLGRLTDDAALKWHMVEEVESQLKSENL